MYMPEQKEYDIHDETVPVAVDNGYWYVMIHHNPVWIQTMLERELRGELLSRQQLETGLRREPFEFYVPYFDIQRERDAEIRNDFRKFVFINASEKRIGELLTADWNTNTRLRLYHYRNKMGEKIRVRNSDIRGLQMAIRRFSMEYFEGVPDQPLTQFAEGSKVRIKLPCWEDKEGEIRRIHVRTKTGTASMRVAFVISGLEREVTFPELHEGDVEFLDQQTRQLLSGKVIENFENEVAIILGHRYAVGKKQGETARQAYVAEKKREDAPKLRRMLSFADIDMDSDDDRRRFTALMLMCAVLLGDAEAVQRYQQQVEQYLKEDGFVGDAEVAEDGRRLSTPTAAYLAIALFVATKNPDLRTAVKAFRDGHPDCPPIISRFINKVRDARAKKR